MYHENPTDQLFHEKSQTPALRHSWGTLRHGVPRLPSPKKQLAAQSIPWHTRRGAGKAFLLPLWSWETLAQGESSCAYLFQLHTPGRRPHCIRSGGRGQGRSSRTQRGRQGWADPGFQVVSQEETEWAPHRDSWDQSWSWTLTEFLNLLRTQSCCRYHPQTLLKPLQCSKKIPVSNSTPTPAPSQAKAGLQVCILLTQTQSNPWAAPSGFLPPM